jgi:hypothetical protein
MAQPVEFVFFPSREHITVSGRDCERLTATMYDLASKSDEWPYLATARSIESAMQLGGSTRVELKPAEDTAVLRALDLMDPLSQPLRRLKRALVRGGAENY